MSQGVTQKISVIMSFETVELRSVQRMRLFWLSHNCLRPCCIPTVCFGFFPESCNDVVTGTGKKHVAKRSPDSIELFSTIRN